MPLEQKKNEKTGILGPSNIEDKSVQKSIPKKAWTYGDNHKKIDHVLHLSIDKDEVIKRIEKRQLEENRKDDNTEVLKSRIEVYLKETRPLIELYKKEKILKKIDGMKSIENVSIDINAIL